MDDGITRERADGGKLLFGSRFESVGSSWSALDGTLKGSGLSIGIGMTEDGVGCCSDPASADGSD